MENKETYQFDLLQRLSFNRFGGTEDELKAAHLLLEEIEKLGGKGEIMDFEIPAYDIQKAAITVVEPFQKEIECQAYGLSGELPEGGADFKLQYLEVNSPAGWYHFAKDLSDTAVLVNTLDFDTYHELVKRNAGALIVIAADKWHNTDETTDLISRAMRPVYLKAGKIPSFTIRSKDATEIVRDEATKVHLELRQTERMTTSRDVLATIEGTEITDECVVVTAHYDSVTVGTGSWDNGTGAVTIMYVYNHFLHNPPRRTMRFIWCGSEEQGLYGSKAYVEQKKDLLPSIRFCFNFDMNGTILGSNSAFLTGGDDLKALTEQLGNEYGYPMTVRAGVHSSDSAPFAQHGIPSVGLSRGTRSAEIHTRYDLMNPISRKKLHENGEFAIFFISRFVNAAIFPVKRELPENIRKDVDKYFNKAQFELLEKEAKEKAEKAEKSEEK